MFGEEPDETLVDEERRPESSGVLAFHNGTEEALFIYVKQHSQKGDCVSILRAIDDFCYRRHWMMHMGDTKVGMLLQSVRAAQAQNESIYVVELGSYCGYSAVAVGAILRDGDHMLCVEAERLCADWTQRMVTHAQLDTRVIVLHCDAGNVDQWSRNLLTSQPLTLCDNNTSHGTIDLLFVDHDKASYFKDVAAIESAGLLTTGSVVVADNVLSFGKPLTEYLDYVRDPSGPFSSSELHESMIEYAIVGEISEDKEQPEQRIDLRDGVEISIHK